MEVIIKNNYQEVSRLAAAYLMKTVEMKEDAIIGLPTGSTPLGMYKEVIDNYKGRISFQKVRTFNLDEYVGLDRTNVNSYRYFMDENLFSHIDIKEENIHIPNGVAPDLEQECRNYEELLKTRGRMDIIFLGIGQNGHIGFNEPGDCFEPYTHIVRLTENTINANKRFFDDIEKVPKTAITMGIKTILSAKKIVLLATGSSKAEAIFKTVKGKITPRVPASILQLHDDVTLIIDEEAAKLM
ncbi:MAG TPA: glucosamine-6-phosphate deaminase [Sedimentibacter sp.]|jgi:glucosamine-6-phosphate deaminase|nr:glucosamine-6-phosphate deaminase [Sedimentibacter sp.]HHY99801.1 glucosamine-6-phosphate deaminase [Tissierellia bacterium]HOK49076.1 glucosamine-6-phosphate deaminase [Sedimentibacter sp.]HOW23006.1 glucosamine-6-phosphate deaminase [Sedimentibacter sp.]HRC80243.1 glucosamine-6-phosphate deaminase [Sedimentibacter sp.]